MELDLVFVRPSFIPRIVQWIDQGQFDSLFTAGTLTGFDASGHIAEETKNAR